MNSPFFEPSVPSRRATNILSLANARRKKAYSDFDGDAGVDAMLVVEIDTSDVEAFQAGLASSPHVRGVASHLTLPIRKADPELGSQLHSLSHPSLERLLIIIDKHPKIKKRKKKPLIQ